MLSMIEDILSAEAQAIRAIPADNPFVECVALFLEAKRSGGKVVISGVGKAGEVGKKMATTFCSVGVPSVFLHPLEAQHGDLGVLHAQDVLVLITNSGKTREVLELEQLAKRLHPQLRQITITGNRESVLAQHATYVLWNGNPKEVCPLGLTPTTSTTTMTVIGDVLAVLVVRISNYTAGEYALRHHSGYLGDKSKEDARRQQAPAAGPTPARVDDTSELRALYALMHQENADYQSANWLMDDLPRFLGRGYASLVELGTGNGRFARAVCVDIPQVVAIDWVESPLMGVPPPPKQLEFRIQDILTTALPCADVMVSADFLETLPTTTIDGLLRRMAKAAAHQFHVIACYPDSRGMHLTNRPPDFWLAAFRAIDPGFALVRLHQRRGRADQTVVTIARGFGSSLAKP